MSNNQDPERCPIVVIGASAGGIETLELLAGGLPQDFPAALFVVVHLSPDSPGALPGIIARAGKLPTMAAQDGAAIRPGHIFVAPPDHHLLLEPGRIRLTRGPRENRFRPAIDPLFRSAAYAYGPQVFGVILSGTLDDGTAGLWAIKDRGGVAIVQEPTEALYASMPLSALKFVRVDYRLPVVEIARLLDRLTREAVADKGAVAMSEAMQPGAIPPDAARPDALQIETEIALEANPLAAGVMTLGPPSPYTCPECNGVLMQLQEDGILRFRCHTGHAYSVGTLLAGISDSIEKTLWNAVRTLEENMLLLRHLGHHAEGQHDETLARRLALKAQIAEDQVQIMRQLAQRNREQDQIPL
jgi:two-component system chemotaxis response regulator CheB